MKIDIVSIFPAYLDALQLSLVGKAIRTGLVELGVHDLRSWTHDRHRTVDDTPYGGGAGMVMSPGPWGEALDALCGPSTILVVPTPSGEPFSQLMAHDLADESHLVFACGRYEGIDARVMEHARSRGRVIEVSLGDYVLNGGEVAALAVVEAVVRLIPGVVGNPDSLAEESHSIATPGGETDGLLEYPVYTKPPQWRGLDVPGVLLGGDHQAIAAWRRAESVRRTAERRPDLIRDRDTDYVITRATPADAGEALTVQKAAFSLEAATVGSSVIPPLLETLAELRATIEVSTSGTSGQAASQFWVARLDPPDGRPGRLVGAVRGSVDDQDPTAWHVGRLMVAPDQHGRGIGAALMAVVEQHAPPGCTRIRLITAEASTRNHRFYRRRGYRRIRRLLDSEGIGVVVLERPLAGVPPGTPGAAVTPG